MKSAVSSLFLIAVVFIIGCSKADLSLFDSGKTKLAGGDTAGAVVDLEKFVTEYSKSERSAEALFLLASIFDRKQIAALAGDPSIEKAVTYYEKLYTDFPDDSLAANAMLSSASLLAFRMQNPEKAITTLEKMIDKYRDNQVLTPLALYDLGAIYQNQSDPKLKGEKSFYKAIEYFNQILQKFPNAEIAPKALMNIGFIQENHLQKFEEAKATYQKLIDQYPASNLVESAKQAKAIVGVPPEEIINRTRVAKK